MNEQTQSPINTTPKAKWYQKSFGIILLLILFFPIGIYLMWKYAKWSKAAKIIISTFIGIIFIMTVTNPKTREGVEDSLDKELNKPQEEVTTQPTQEVTTQPSPKITPEELAPENFNKNVFTGYVEDNLGKGMVRNITYEPEQNNISVDYNIANGLIDSEELAQNLLLDGYSDIVDLFKYSQGIRLYPEETDVVFNSYYLGEKIGSYNFDSKTIEETDWSKVTTPTEFESLWKSFSINE